MIKKIIRLSFSGQQCLLAAESDVPIRKIIIKAWENLKLDRKDLKCKVGEIPLKTFDLPNKDMAKVSDIDKISADIHHKYSLLIQDLGPYNG